MIKKIYIVFCIMLLCGLFSCKNNSSSDEGDDRGGAVITPVTITHIIKEPMSDNILLNAVSVFQKKSVIKSYVNGYVEKEMISPGQTINDGQVLFIMKTKEAQVLDHQTIDSTLQFTGVVYIKASQNGFITQLDHQQGDYVMDGEQLCIIADRSSFVFQLEVPFELTPYVNVGHDCDIILSDGQHLAGRIASKVPMVNPVTQTQLYIIKINPAIHLPENLIAKISVPKSVVSDATVLPKSALLTNVNQTQWWVMKMINDSTAVKIPVEKGLESDSTVQIIAPQFSSTDRILTSGNYGLPDTALVDIQH